MTFLTDLVLQSRKVPQILWGPINFNLGHAWEVGQMEQVEQTHHWCPV